MPAPCFGSNRDRRRIGRKQGEWKPGSQLEPRIQLEYPEQDIQTNHFFYRIRRTNLIRSIGALLRNRPIVSACTLQGGSYPLPAPLFC